MIRIICGGVAALALSVPAMAAPEKPVSIKDPAAFVETVKQMGYAPEPMLKDVTLPAFLMQVGTLQTRFTFGGCTNAKNCTYLYLSSSYTDVKAPPADWLVKMNDNFDIIKVSVDAENFLFFSATHVIEGVPRSTLRQILEMWEGDASSLADEATKANLVKAE